MIANVRRLFRGYQLLFTGFLRFAAMVLILAAVSVGISLPLWFLAHHLPRVFDLAILAAGFIVLVLLVVRKVRRPTTPRRGSVTFSPLSRGTIGIALLVSVLSIGVGYGALGVIGIVAVSGYVAWRIVPR